LICKFLYLLIPWRKTKSFNDDDLEKKYPVGTSEEYCSTGDII